MQEHPYTKKILSTNDISVLQTDDASLLRIIYNPFFFFEIMNVMFLAAILGVGLLVINLDRQEELDNLVFVAMIGFASLYLFFTSLLKRGIFAVFNSAAQTLDIKYGGVYSTKIASFRKQIHFSNIALVGIKRYIRRGGDGFQVFIILKNEEKMNLTGRDLLYSEAHLCGETIKDFLGIKDKIVAFD